MKSEISAGLLDGGGEPSATQAHLVPHILIQPKKTLFHLDLGEVWHYQELLYFLVWRDVKIRYKQTLIGAGWVMIQPLLTMLVFAVVFGYFAGIPSDGVPYAIFSYTGLLPWNYFAQAVTRSGASVVNNASLVSKVYFPRLIIPLAAVVSPAIDFSVAFILLIGLMAWYSIIPTWGVLALPIFMLLAVMTAWTISLFLSALYVKYRDVGHIIPFLTQLWMFASPVVYPVSLVPEQWRLLYSLNPMVGVIEGFRWALLGKASPDFGVMAISAAVIIVLLCAGIVYFKKMERIFADVI
jgi:lipopolysaccharide transport system permease protein